MTQQNIQQEVQDGTRHTRHARQGACQKPQPEAQEDVRQEACKPQQQEENQQSPQQKRTYFPDSSFSEEEKDALRMHVNSRISHFCAWAALVVILVAFASFILGHFDTFMVQFGIMVSIALLAIAAINNPTRKK